MATSRDLYELIGTLTKTEKRYCRLMLAAGTGRKAHSCGRLFDLLCAMPTPNEASLREVVTGESFAGHLAVTKGHLYEHLLRSLRAFGTAKQTWARVHALVEGARVLVDRGLELQARRRLHEARLLAERHEYLPEQLLIARLELRIDSNIGFNAVTTEDQNARRQRVKRITEAIDNYWDYLHLDAVAARELLLHGTASGTVGGPDGGQRLRELLVAPLANVQPPSTAAAAHMHRRTLRTYHLLMGRYNNGYEHSCQTLATIESYPLRERMEFLDYVSMLYNHVMVALRTGHEHAARTAFERLKSLKPEGHSAREHHRQLVFSCRLELAMLTFDEQTIVAMEPELQAIIASSNASFARQLRMGYYVELAVAQLAHGRPRAALGTLHPVINDNRPGFRDDILCIARLLRMMIHYDLGDTELLPYLVRSTYRFIAQCRGVSGVDRAVLRFMRRLPAIVTNEQLITEFARIRTELENIAADSAEREASSLQCFMPWLDAHINGCTYGEAVRHARQVSAANTAKTIAPQPEHAELACHDAHGVGMASAD